MIFVLLSVNVKSKLASTYIRTAWDSNANWLEEFVFIGIEQRRDAHDTR